MIVSEQSGFVFVHNPKCGGSVFRRSVATRHDHPETFWYLRRVAYFGIVLDYAHLRMWEVQALHPDVLHRLRSQRSVMFVRNPLDRFISALHQHVRTYHPFVAIDGLAEHERLALFHRIARDELTPARILTDYRYVHFSPQIWFCLLGDQRVVETIIPMGPGLNPIALAGKALGFEIQADDWHVPEGDRANLLADGLLNDVSDRLYAGDRAFFETMPHLHSVL